MAAGAPAAEQADTTARTPAPAIVPNALARLDATPMRINLARLPASHRPVREIGLLPPRPGQLDNTGVPQ
jgi:hypothetical protein